MSIRVPMATTQGPDLTATSTGAAGGVVDDRTVRTARLVG